jgi:hypothetical protein
VGVTGLAYAQSQLESLIVMKVGGESCGVVAGLTGELVVSQSNLKITSVTCCHGRNEGWGARRAD